MAPTVLRRHSLKTKITLASIGVFLAGLWALSFYISLMLREDMVRLLGEQQFSATSIIATDVGHELDSRLKALEIVAKAAAPAMLDGPAAMQAFVERQSVLQSLFSGGVVAHGADGTAIADFPMSAGRIGVNYMEYSHIATALTNGIAAFGKPVLGKMLKSPVFGISTPIRDAHGKVIGALTGVINLGIPNFLDLITAHRYGKTAATCWSRRSTG